METIAEKYAHFYKTIAAEQNVPPASVKNVIVLLEDGNTVPFIARYRKEQTGALDEVQIRNIMERWNYLVNLQQRKEEVIRLIDAQGKLTEDLKRKIEKAMKLQEVEDLYRPYKQKKNESNDCQGKRFGTAGGMDDDFSRQGSLHQKAEEFLSEERGYFRRTGHLRRERHHCRACFR